MGVLEGFGIWEEGDLDAHDYGLTSPERESRGGPPLPGEDPRRDRADRGRGHAGERPRQVRPERPEHRHGDPDMEILLCTAGNHRGVSDL